MIVDIKAVVGYFRKGGDLSRARAVEEAYYIYADNMAKAKPETVCELEMPEVKPSHDRKLLEPDWLAREVSDLRREVDALKAERSEVGSTSHCDDCGGRIKAGGTCYCEGREWGRVDPQWVVIACGPCGFVSNLRYNLPAEKASEYVGGWWSDPPSVGQPCRVRTRGDITKYGVCLWTPGSWVDFPVMWDGARQPEQADVDCLEWYPLKFWLARVSP